MQRGYDEMGEAVGLVTNWQTLAENIEELRFEYLLDDWSWVNGTSPIPDDRSIRAIKIVMLGAARSSIFNPRETTIYVPPLDDPAGGDTSWDMADPQYGLGYKRIMATIVECRNNRG